MVRPLARDRLAVRERGGGVKKTVALALGGGGARALSQIPVLEALDELGVKPVAVGGVSFGAVIAAAYCAGMSGKAIRRAVIALAHDRSAVFSRLMAARAAGLSDWLSTPFGNPLLIDAEKFCDEFCRTIARRFRDLKSRSPSSRPICTAAARRRSSTARCARGRGVDRDPGSDAAGRARRPRAGRRRRGQSAAVRSLARQGRHRDRGRRRGRTAATPGRCPIRGRRSPRPWR